MKTTVFASLLTAIVVCVAYNWVSDWYYDFRHNSAEGILYKDYGYNMPIEPIINEPTPDPGPPEYEENHNSVTTKVWKGQTMSIPPSVTPTPIWETCRIEDTKIHWHTKRVMGGGDIVYDEYGNCTKHPDKSKIKVDNSIVYWPDYRSISSTGWHINLCVGDDVIYTFR